MDSTDSKSGMIFQAETSNRPAGSNSEARQHHVSEYRWGLCGDGSTYLEGPPPTGWTTNSQGTAFTPTTYSLPYRYPSTYELVTVLVQNLEISADEFFGFASAFGRISRAKHTADPELVSVAAVRYESRIHAYRLFDQLYLQGYNATITIVSALSVK